MNVSLATLHGRRATRRIRATTIKVSSPGHNQIASFYTRKYNEVISVLTRLAVQYRPSLQFGVIMHAERSIESIQKQNRTSNLSKAHVTRDNSGPATLQ